MTMGAGFRWNHERNYGREDTYAYPETTKAELEEWRSFERDCGDTTGIAVPDEVIMEHRRRERK